MRGDAKELIIVSEEVRMLGARIREMRELLEIAPKDLASGLGVTVETYLAFEKGEQDIPISTLYELARRFGVDFTVLLTGESPRMDTHCLVRNGGGVRVERYAGYQFQSLGFNYKNRTMEPMIVALEPSEKAAALVTHSGQEFNYVLDGQVKVVVGAREFILSPGDSLYFNPALPHGQRAVGGPCRFLTVIQE